MHRKFNPDHFSTIICPSPKTCHVYPKLFLHLTSCRHENVSWNHYFDDYNYVFHYPELLWLHCPKFLHVQFSKPDFFCSRLFAHRLLQIEIERKHYKITLECRKNGTHSQTAKGNKNQIFNLLISSTEITVLQKTKIYSQPQTICKVFSLRFW